MLFDIIFFNNISKIIKNKNTRNNRNTKKKKNKKRIISIFVFYLFHFSINHSHRISKFSLQKEPTIISLLKCKRTQRFFLTLTLKKTHVFYMLSFRKFLLNSLNQISMRTRFLLHNFF